MRNPRYNISFAYITSPQLTGDKIININYGIQEPRLMSSIDVEYFIKVLNPLKCKEWLDNISRIRRGGYVVFELNSQEDNGVMLKKIVKIERN